MRGKTPNKIANAPILTMGLELYFYAFWDLSTCRGENEIPWTSALEYAKLAGFDEDEFQVFWTIIRAMDAEYLKFREKKAKAK